MGRLVWGIAGLGLLAWTLLAWLGHAVIEWGSGLAASGAIALPVTGEAADWLSWSALLLGNVSEVVVIIVWALGAAMILAVAAVAKRLLVRRAAPPVPFRSGVN